MLQVREVPQPHAGAEGFVVGDRVYGGAMAKAAADFVVMKIPAAMPDALFHTPDGISDGKSGRRFAGGRPAIR